MYTSCNALTSQKTLTMPGLVTVLYLKRTVGLKFGKMKSLLILISSAFCAVRASDQFSFSCARKFFQEEEVATFVVVDSTQAGHNDSPIDSFFRSMDTENDWSITVVSNIFRAMDVQKNEISKSVILFVSSPTHIGPVFANIQMTNTRIFVVLTNAHPSRESIRSVFRKFGTPMQSHVIVMERMGDNFWKFYKYVDDRCPFNGIKSVVMVADCNDSASGANIRHFSNGLQVKEKSCPLIVATNQFEPFTYYDDVKGFYNGIDYSIVKTISERLQLVVKFVRTGNGLMIDPKIIE